MILTAAEAAALYAARGWHVFPVFWPVMVPALGRLACSCPKGIACPDLGKHPATPRGQSQATTDAGIVARWWATFPDANIGLSLQPSGLMAFDVDLYKGDQERLAELVETLGDLPDTPTQVSGSGEGAHMIFAAPPGALRGKIGSGAGVTVRGRNYIVMAPSLHRSGGRYSWVDGASPEDLAPAELPDTWKAALARPAEVDGATPGAPDAASEPPWLTAIPQDVRIAKMREHLGREEGERKGVSRQGMAFDVARTAARGHAVRDPSAVLAAMLEIFNPRCDPPYDPPRIAERVEGAYRDAVQPDWGSSLMPEDVRIDADGMAGLIAIGNRVAEPTVPASPRGELAAALGAAQKKLARSHDVKHVRQCTVLKLINHGTPLEIRADENEDKLVDEVVCIAALHAPAGATGEHLAELLGSTLPTRAGEPLVALCRDALARRPTPKTTPTGRLPEVDDDTPAPKTDEDLRGLLLGGKDDDSFKVCGTNIERVLRWSQDTRGMFRFDELRKEIVITGGRFATEPKNSLDVAVSNWLEAEWGIFGGIQTVAPQVLYAARRYGGFDPLVDYLSTLVWDGTPRIGDAGAEGDLGTGPGWLETYCCASTTDDRGADVQWYVRRVGAMWLMSAVARAFEPGVKADCVLVLEGEQGLKKSTVLKELGGAWFTDTPIDVENKDSRMVAAVRWIAELAELASLRRSDKESHKAFLSASTDDFRPPYGRVIESFARRCVFGGTMNPTPGEGYLVDETGNRRWWGVRVNGAPETGELRVAELSRDRDQLWAEAVARYRRGLGGERAPADRWWFDRREQLVVDAVAEDRVVENPWADIIAAWCEKQTEVCTVEGPMMGKPVPRETFTLQDVARGALNIDEQNLPRQIAMLRAAMRSAGYMPHRSRVAGSKQRRWIRKYV